MRNLYALFLIIPLILSIGIIPALPFANAGVSDVFDCRDGQTLVRNLQHGYLKCMESSKADRFAQLGLVELVTEKSMDKPKTEKPVPVSLLFVQMATSGSFTETDDGYSLVLEGINPLTVYFTDRPNRIAGHMSTEELVNKWPSGNDSFEKDPPNAVMAIVEPDGTQNAITIALTNPVYDLETMTLQYTAYIIKDEVDAAEQVDVSFPEEFGDVALFIDDQALTCPLADGGASGRVPSSPSDMVQRGMTYHCPKMGTFYT